MTSTIVGDLLVAKTGHRRIRRVRAPSEAGITPWQESRYADLPVGWLRTGKPCPPVTPMKEDADGVSF
ncbi:hypothetical protein [Mycobacterium ulcerans]|uniref:hypothetical protein n=1 Tax=Mycobacterium ulcerans TaxID=1809 RepID=UPI0010697299|nr:hypothetical protein [Mycobacterium ulcerans]